MKAKTRYLFYPLLTVLLFLLAFPLPVLAAANGTIILKSGQEYRNVTFKIDHYYKVVTIFITDAMIDVSFNEIDSIIDNEGMDVTNDLLKRLHKEKKRSRETWRSKTDPVIKKARTKLWNTGIRFASNFSLPADDYYEGIGEGIGFEGDIIVAVTNNVALRFSVSKSGMQFEDPKSSFSPHPDTLVTAEYGINAVRYYFSAEYYHRPDRKTPGRSIYYFYSGLGAINHKLSFDATMYVKSTRELFIASDRASETKFATTCGAGMIQLLSKNIGIDLGVAFDMIWVRSHYNDYSYIGVSGYIFDMKLGVIALL